MTNFLQRKFPNFGGWKFFPVLCSCKLSLKYALTLSKWSQVERPKVKATEDVIIVLLTP